MEGAASRFPALHNILQALAIASFVLLVWKAAKYGRRERALPPGPPTMFGSGNAQLIPKRDLHLKLTEYAREYGEIYSLKVFHETLVVLTSPAAVRALLEHDSAISQGRPTLWLIDKWAYKQEHLAWTSHPMNISRLRRAFAAVLNPTASLSYLPVLEAESCQLLYDILMDSETYYTSIRRYTFSVMLSVTYGVRAPRWETPSVRMFYDYMETLTHLLALGATPPLDIFPVLRLIPEWFAPWKANARVMLSQEQTLNSEMLRLVKNKSAADAPSGCIMEEAIAQQSKWGLTDRMLSVFGGTLLQGGAETTSAFLLSALLLLLSQPSVQLRAQEELDRVVGSDRLPTPEDEASLPYISAIIKEVDRMRPATPLGVPHRMTADQTYQGYTIPKGSSVFINTWGMGHDPALFENPDTFWPERFMIGGEVTALGTGSPKIPTFGVGRRVCVGRHIAPNVMYMAISKVLWGFNIRNTIDPRTGNERSVNTMDYGDGVIYCPNEFPCHFQVRSDAHRRTIMRNLRQNQTQLEQFEGGLSAEDLQYLKRTREGLAE